MFPYFVKNLLRYRKVSTNSCSRIESQQIYYYDLTLVVSGSCIYKHNNKEYRLSANDAILLPPDSFRERLPKNRVEYYSFNFISHSDIKLPVFMPNVVNEKILTILETISFDKIEDLNFELPKISNVINIIIFELLEKYSTHTTPQPAPFIKNKESLKKHTISKDFVFETRMPKNKTVRAAIEYIYDNIDKKLSCRLISEQLYVSKEYLSKIFKKETGKTITKYINFVKVLYASNLLTNNELSITEIASIVGYDNYNYFSTTFKDILGQSPLEFRKSHQ